MSDCAFGQGTQMWTNVALAQTPSSSPPTGGKCTKEARQGQVTPYYSKGFASKSNIGTPNIVLDHMERSFFSEINWAWMALNQSRLSAAAAATSTLSWAKELTVPPLESEEERRRTGPPNPPASPFLVGSSPGPIFRWREQFQESESWVSSWVSTSPPPSPPQPHPSYLCWLRKQGPSVTWNLMGYRSPLISLGGMRECGVG